MSKSRRPRDWLTWLFAASTIALVLTIACGQKDRDRAQGRRIGDDVAAEIQELDVRIALLEGMGEDSFEVGVEARGDGITLTGFVHEESSRKRARALAAQSAAGSTIRDRIQVRHRFEDPTTAASDAIDEALARTADALTEARVRRNLLARLGRDVLNASVRVKAGVVSLDAPRLDDRERELARQTAAETSGVEKVLEGVSAS
jgi:osmotically-inducible protein OsmY